MFLANKTFTIRDPQTGRTYKFEKGQTIKGAKTKYIKQRHIDDAWVIPFASTKNDCSIQRRLEGRLFWHKQNQTDWTMDAECLVYDIGVKVIGNDELRAKGSGQTSIFSKITNFVETNFGDKITVEVVPGTDDVTANREANDRWIRWIDTPQTSSELQFALWQFINNEYAN